MKKLNEKKLEENLVNNQSYYGKGFTVFPRSLLDRICEAVGIKILSLRRKNVTKDETK
jgi:hypothetical protein